MKTNVTKISPKYPLGEEPDYIDPLEYNDCRFGLGRIGASPLVVICMNPSAAREESSDHTINTIISMSKTLGNNGWVVFNLYPERATEACEIENFNEEWSAQNIKVIKKFLIANHITEVFGAWGDDKKVEALIKGRTALLSTLKEMGVKVYHFGTLTKSGNPRHILQRHEKRDFTNKIYLEI